MISLMVKKFLCWAVKGWGSLNPLYSSGLYQHTMDCERSRRNQAQKTCLPFLCFNPIPCAPFMEDVSPVLATLRIRAGEVHNYSAHLHGALNRLRDPWATRRYYYLVLNYMKIKSHKKKQNTDT